MNDASLHKTAIMSHLVTFQPRDLSGRGWEYDEDT
jgi:hypothetical protein